MTLFFPYRLVPVTGFSPPTLPPRATHRYRPLVSIRIINPLNGNVYSVADALFDSGADDSIFPQVAAHSIALSMLPSPGRQSQIHWHGSAWPMQFGDVLLELNDGTSSCQWPARVAFSPAPIRYPLLGQMGCLQFFNATFRGADRIAELEPDPSFPGTTA